TFFEAPAADHETAQKYRRKERQQQSGEGQPRSHEDHPPQQQYEQYPDEETSAQQHPSLHQPFQAVGGGHFLDVHFVVPMKSTMAFAARRGGAVIAENPAKTFRIVLMG